MASIFFSHYNPARKNNQERNPIRLLFLAVSYIIKRSRAYKRGKGMDGWKANKLEGERAEELEDQKARRDVPEILSRLLCGVCLCDSVWHIVSKRDTRAAL